MPKLRRENEAKSEVALIGVQNKEPCQWAKISRNWVSESEKLLVGEKHLAYCWRQSEKIKAELFNLSKKTDKKQAASSKHLAINERHFQMYNLLPLLIIFQANFIWPD